MPTTLTLIIPDFIPDKRYALLARATKQHNAYQEISSLLCSLFGLDISQELPIAAITGLIDNLPTQTGFWMRADPVELRIDLATVHLLGNQHLNISLAESEKLQQSLNAFLKQDNLILHTPHPKRWYLQLPKPMEIKTYPLDYAVAKDLYAHLPSGAEQTYWRRLFTEVQMLLHPQDQRPNQINGLWFWGTGNLPKLSASPWQIIWTDEVLTQGLAKLAHSHSQILPEHFSHCLAAINKPRDYLIVMNEPPSDIETHWFKPILSALQKGRLNHVQLYLGNHTSYRLTRLASYQFWKN